MNSITLSEHRCANKCTDFKAQGEQCNHCMIQHIEKQEAALGLYLRPNLRSFAMNFRFAW
jgi:hypothetical protein